MSDEGYGPSAAHLRLCEEQHVRELRAIITEHNRTCAEGSECESCVAPRLARENLRLRDECWQHQRDAGKWWSELADANGKLTRLLAVVDGRTTAPTDAEIEAHTAGGGTWLSVGVSAGGGIGGVVTSSLTRSRRDTATATLRWWAMHGDGFCAWPTVTP